MKLDKKMINMMLKNEIDPSQKELLWLIKNLVIFLFDEKMKFRWRNVLFNLGVLKFKLLGILTFINTRKSNDND